MTMMMIDELDETVARLSGPRCGIQRLRETDEAKAVQAYALMQKRGYTFRQKQEVLLKHGLDFHRMSIERHMRRECQGCVQWVS